MPSWGELSLSLLWNCDSSDWEIMSKLPMNITMKCSSWYLRWWCWFICDAVTVFQRLFTLKLTCCSTQVPFFKLRRDSMKKYVFIACYWDIGGVINHWMVSSILNGPEGTKNAAVYLWNSKSCHFHCEMRFFFCRLLASSPLCSIYSHGWPPVLRLFACSLAQPWLTSGHNGDWDPYQHQRKLKNKSARSEHKEMSQAFEN